MEEINYIKQYRIFASFGKGEIYIKTLFLVRRIHRVIGVTIGKGPFFWRVGSFRSGLFRKFFRRKRLEFLALFFCEDAFEKLDVRNALVQAFFVQQEEFCPDGLDVRVVERGGVQKIVQAFFCNPYFFPHFAPEGIAGFSVGIQFGDLLFGKSQRAVHLFFEFCRVRLFFEAEVRGTFELRRVRFWGRTISMAENRGAGEESGCGGQDDGADPEDGGVFHD